MAMYQLDVGALVNNDPCEMARKSYNDARFIFLGYTALTFLLVTALVLASIYAIIAFNDDVDSRGYLALLAAVAAGGVSVMLGKLTKEAKDHQDKMFERVVGACPVPKQALGS